MVDREWTDFGERVRLARLTAGMSQSELGTRTRLDRTMIAKIETGVRRVDALELVRLSAALEVAVDHLLEPVPTVFSRRGQVLTEDSTTDAGRQAARLETALTGWLRDVRQLVELRVLQALAPVLPTGRVASEQDARALALRLRQEQGLGTGPVGSMVDLAEQCGQSVLVTEVPGDGASVVDGDIAVAVVSLRGDPGRRRATAAHELGHLIVGDEYSSDLGVHTSRKEREAVVDAFASELLLPLAVVRQEAENPDGLSRERLVRLTAQYRTSWSLAIRQATLAGVLDSQTARRWRAVNPTHVEFMEGVGWAPQPDLESVRVPPRYAHAVMEAWRRGLVTDRRTVELMHGQITASDLPERTETDLTP